MGMAALGEEPHQGRQAPTAMPRPVSVWDRSQTELPFSYILPVAKSVNFRQSSGFSWHPEERITASHWSPCTLLQVIKHSCWISLPRQRKISRLLH